MDYYYKRKAKFMQVVCWNSINSFRPSLNLLPATCTSSSSVLLSIRHSDNIRIKEALKSQNFTWDKADACKTELLMWISSTDIIFLPAVTAPRRNPELMILLNESSLITRPSVSRERNDVGCLSEKYMWQ